MGFVIVLDDGIMMYFLRRYAKVKEHLGRQEFPWMGRILYVLCERVLSLLIDQNQFVGRYDISVTEKSNCLSNMLVKGSDQN